MCRNLISWVSRKCVAARIVFLSLRLLPLILMDMYVGGIINIYTVASCWFSLSLHNVLRLLITWMGIQNMVGWLIECGIKWLNDSVEWKRAHRHSMLTSIEKSWTIDPLAKLEPFAEIQTCPVSRENCLAAQPRGFFALIRSRYRNKTSACTG